MEKVDEGVRLSRRSLPYDNDDYNWIDGFFFFSYKAHMRLSYFSLRVQAGFCILHSI